MTGQRILSPQYSKKGSVVLHSVLILIVFLCVVILSVFMLCFSFLRVVILSVFILCFPWCIYSVV